MPKKVINDIIIPPKSIRQIPLSPEKKAPVKKEKVNYRQRFNIPKVQGNRKSLNPKFVIWLIAIIALLALFFGVSLIFSSAKLVIVPRSEKLLFNNETYTAKLDSPGSGNLSYEILKIEKTDGLIVEATEEKVANQKASGKIVIYNNYSSASQRLINNTRFEANSGKIYRISNSVDVPGTKVVAGKTIPGSVEVTVFADQPGEEYNLKLADLDGDFKIPGFKGSPRYDSFYARLKTDITGGMIGKQKIVGTADRKVAEETLKASLKESLLKELYAIKPDNYIVFANSYSIDYVVLPDTDEGFNKVKINVRGNLNSVVFNSLKLATYIANKKIKDFDSLPVTIIFDENLTTVFNAKDDSNLWKNDTLGVKFNGQASIKWLYDLETMKKDLIGKPASSATDILLKYKDQVTSISVSFSPIWTRYFPDKLDKIKITELD